MRHPDSERKHVLARAAGSSQLAVTMVDERRTHVAAAGGCFAARELVVVAPDPQLVAVHELGVVRVVLGPAAVRVDDAGEVVGVGAGERGGRPLPLVLVEVAEGADAVELAHPVALHLERPVAAVVPPERVDEHLPQSRARVRVGPVLPLLARHLQREGAVGARVAEDRGSGEGHRDLRAGPPVRPHRRASVRPPLQVPDAGQVHHGL
mmetsp:Transcript_9773/g.19586  ORF Transcript_9773/g.19586 Transcript_9773/m.19586 type:complete len:208 (-) Transcript_9773:220-843(-)